MNDVALELVDLKRSFTQGDVTIEVLRGVNASLRRGEIVALLGPSGSGKSTMLQAVGLLEGGFEGIIRIEGEDVTHFEQGERTKTRRSEEHTSELQSLMRNSYAVFCLKKKTKM